MPYTEAKMDFLGDVSGDDGTKYFWAKVREGNSDKDVKDGKINYDIELLIIAPNLGEVKTKKVETENKFLNNLWMFEHKKGEITCAGYYSKDSKSRGDTDGILICKLDEEGNTYDVKTYEIPSSIITQYEKKKKNELENNGNRDFDNLKLNQLIGYEDGSIILIGQEEYDLTPEYRYNDLLVTKIDPDGELAWMKKLPKNQLSLAALSGARAYKHFYDEEEGQHYFLFIDRKDNVLLPIGEKPKRYDVGPNGILSGYTVANETGKVARVAILDTENVQGQKIYNFNLYRVFDINSKAFIFEVYKKKKEDILIKVSLK